MSKWFCRFLVFSFVFMWHCPGSEWSLSMWVLSNFLFLHIEMFIEKLSRIEFGISYVNRLKIILGSQLLFLSTISSVFFLYGNHIAVHIIIETYSRDKPYFIFGFILYSIYHSCAYLNSYGEKTK